MTSSFKATFRQNYAAHLKHLKLKGLQPKTIEAYSRAIRRIGAYFDYRIIDPSEQQLLDYFTQLLWRIPFTLPAELRPLVWRNQRILYNLIMQSAWETVQTFSENDRQLQGSPGAIAVLHTHSRQLAFHPHVHLIMPAAAINAKSRLWRTKSKGTRKKRYLFNHKALANVFRAYMLEGITQAGLILPAHDPQQWVVNCKAVGSDEKALIYLDRYLFYKGVTQEKDIVACENGKVTFRYRDSKTRKTVYKTVSGAHFLWLILRHALPKGFPRARNFAFLHPNSKGLIHLLRFTLNIKLTRSLDTVCGQTAVGKTTYSIKISSEINAIRFSIDPWMQTLFSQNMKFVDFSWMMERVERCQNQIWEISNQILGNKGNIVLDLGFTTKDQRSTFIDRAKKLGITAEVHYLDAPTNIRRKRLTKRNTDINPEVYSFEVTDQMFEFMEPRFEPPDREELKSGIKIDAQENT